MTKNEDKRKSLVTREYWSPLSLFEDMERAFDDLRGMREFWLPSIVTRGHRVPVMDLRDTGDGYLMEAEFPGMCKEDVEIEILDNDIRISARKEEATEEEGEGFIRKERGHLSFRRRFTLPADSDVNGVKARLENGVLRVEIPKKEESKDKRMVEVE